MGPQPGIGPGPLLLSLRAAVFCCSVCKNEPLRCYTCAASSEEECGLQGSSVCPQFADACSTITGPGTVIKSCSYKSFCARADDGNPDIKMECCFTENCNGPHQAHSHGGPHNAASTLGSSPALSLWVLLAWLGAGRL
ncbi:hypothetical protein MATL_G00082340 [Megalops atlanticus]|uniref:Snake toxin/toxin-like domain-containing protein n=1 Tax=Megalops atlanticus TaxID=7932 RepID=A0A9D3Q6M0_MEGAT|nr:hypothetical protein MATL_G00082340 [Megalops atlanticus]